ncbi:hypothetical protein PIROE2DRAFT_3452 [Piromyces sp. E2]|nr:hypothetical protein PIROE2DRAFT_3452 [Piromyces sp. E2]|eukprot:OUM68763.1 hypothetical protein PIROE2DRAFT_3452 [Piromyces sp. E2]
MKAYLNVFETLTEAANNTQYFSTFFSWVVVCITYYTIGVRGGSIWKYLFYVATVDFFSSFLGLCWAVSEWVNCVSFRTWISHIDYNYKKEIKKKFSESNEDNPNININIGQDNNEMRNLLLSILFCPLGIVCVFFAFYNIKELIIDNDNEARNNNKALLRSNLTRMLLDDTQSVSTFIFLRELLWKIKSSFGIIFLVDLMLLRIDIDHGNLVKKEKEMKEMEMSSLNSTNEIPLLDEDDDDDDEGYTSHSNKSYHSFRFGRKKSNIDYASDLLSSSRISNNSHFNRTSVSGEYPNQYNLGTTSVTTISNVSVNRYQGKRQSHLSGIEKRLSNISNSISHPKSNMKKKSTYYNMYSKSPLFNHSVNYSFPSNNKGPLVIPSTSEKPNYKPKIVSPSSPSTSTNPPKNLTVDITKNQPINNAFWEYIIKIE